MADHVRRVGGGVRCTCGPAEGVAARPGAVPSLATRRRHRTCQRRAGVDRRRGLHRLALRGRGSGRRRVRGAPGGAGRHAGSAGSQAARQDRSQRLSAVARAAGRWPVAGVVDRADDRVGVAGTGPALQDVGRSTLDVGATDPCRAVPARRDVAGDLDPLGEDPGELLEDDEARDQPGRPPAGPDGVSDDRRHHSRVTTVEGGPAALRPPSARLSCAGRQPVRDRRAVGGGDVVRARRLPTFRPFRASRAPQRPRRHRGPVRRRRAGGFLSRQGPSTLRWALYEAAKNASHHRSPDHDYYTDVKSRLTSPLRAQRIAGTSMSLPA